MTLRHETAIAEVACNHAGFDVANEAMRIMGGAGYSEDSLVEYCFRRTRGWMIGGAAIEILLNRIAEGLCRAHLVKRMSDGVVAVDALVVRA